MDFLANFLNEVLGNKPILVWAVSFFFILVGVIVSLTVSVEKRDRNSPITPNVFNLNFMLRDNSLRLIGSIFVAFSIVRFGEEMTGTSLNYFGCFLLGFSFDRAFSLLAEWQKKTRDVFKSKS